MYRLMVTTQDELNLQAYDDGDRRHNLQQLELTYDSYTSLLLDIRHIAEVRQLRYAPEIDCATHGWTETVDGMCLECQRTEIAGRWRRDA
jgi:hypothetical protein